MNALEFDHLMDLDDFLFLSPNLICFLIYTSRAKKKKKKKKRVQLVSCPIKHVSW